MRDLKFHEANHAPYMVQNTLLEPWVRMVHEDSLKTQSLKIGPSPFGYEALKCKVLLPCH